MIGPRGRAIRFSLGWILAAVALAPLPACQRDHRFHTVAVYDAPRGRYSVHIEASGVVRAGEDLSRQSSGVLSVSPSFDAKPAGPARVVVEITLHDTEVSLDRERFAQGQGDRGEAAMTGLLSRAGYSVDREEAAEVVSAVEGALLGPKATLMSGQTRALSVRSVRFDQ